MSVYFSQPCPIPYHIIHPQFFLFFSKKLHNALWKIAHIGRKYSLPLIQEQALYLIFYGEHSMNHSLILKISSLLPPGSCGGPDTDLKLDIMKLNSHITFTKYIIFVFSDTSKIYDKKSTGFSCQKFYTLKCVHLNYFCYQYNYHFFPFFVEIEMNL